MVYGHTFTQTRQTLISRESEVKPLRQCTVSKYYIAYVSINNKKNIVKVRPFPLF